MSDLQRVLATLFSILLGAFAYHFLSGMVNSALLTIFLSILLFFIGWLFNKKSGGKRSNKVIPKVVAIVLYLFLLFLELNVIRISFVSDILVYFGVSGIFYQLLYIFTGYLFVE